MRPHFCACLRGREGRRETTIALPLPHTLYHLISFLFCSPLPILPVNHSIASRLVVTAAIILGPATALTVLMFSLPFHAVLTCATVWAAIEVCGAAGGQWRSRSGTALLLLVRTAVLHYWNA